MYAEGSFPTQVRTPVQVGAIFVWWADQPETVNVQILVPFHQEFHGQPQPTDASHLS